MIILQRLNRWTKYDPHAMGNYVSFKDPRRYAFDCHLFALCLGKMAAWFIESTADDEYDIVNVSYTAFNMTSLTTPYSIYRVCLCGPLLVIPYEHIWVFIILLDWISQSFIPSSWTKAHFTNTV